MGRRIIRLAWLVGAVALAGSSLGAASTVQPAAGERPSRTDVQASLDRGGAATPATDACSPSASDVPLLERSGAEFVARLERLLHGPDVQVQIAAYLRNARRVI
jgi:hypothetical protein